MAKQDTMANEWLEVASGWRKWGDFIEQGGAEITELLIQKAQIEPGNRVVDVGTGHGDPALTIAARVGDEGHVTAADVSEAMIAVARERAEARGLSNVEFLVADAAEIDLQEAEFDAVVSRHALMFLEDPASSVRRIARALKPGARIAAACWGPPQRVPFLSVAFAPVAKELQLPPPEPGTPGPTALGAPGALEKVFVDAGLSEVESGTATTQFEFDDADQFVELMRDCAPQLAQMLADRPEDAKARVWGEITEGARAFAGKDGRVRMDNEVVWAAGAR